jgi:hypothetical protein
MAFLSAVHCPSFNWISGNPNTESRRVKESELAERRAQAGSFIVEVSDTKRPPQEAVLEITAVFEIELGSF